ncbi:MAG: hypothetical protein QXS20_05225 [Candidatus Thorarchaeota archaeon]
MNKEKRLKRQMTALRKRQNPSVLDLRRMCRMRRFRTELRLLRRATLRTATRVAAE